MQLRLLLSLLAVGVAFHAQGQGCSSCGNSGAASDDGPATGPILSISMGGDVYGASAGHLVFVDSLSVTTLCTSQGLQFNGPTMQGVTVISNSDGSPRQVYAPQALADIPPSTSTNGYVINFYYASQVGSNVSGLYEFSPGPFTTWIITNPVPGTSNSMQITESNAMYGVIKQNTYVLGTNQIWTNLSLGGLTVETDTISTPGSNISVTTETVQSPSGVVVQQVEEIDQTFYWTGWTGSTNTAPVEIVVGTGAAAQITTNTYWDPATFNAGSIVLLKSVVRPDGSWTYYKSYNTNGRINVVNWHPSGSHSGWNTFLARTKKHSVIAFVTNSITGRKGMDHLSYSPPFQVNQPVPLPQRCPESLSEVL